MLKKYLKGKIKRRQEKCAGKIRTKKLFLFLGVGNQKNNCNRQQGSKDVNSDHSVIKNRVHSYSLVKNRLIDQKIMDRISPEITSGQFNDSLKNGPIKTEAKKTWPISRVISDIISSLGADRIICLNYKAVLNLCQRSGSKLLIRILT